MNAKTSLPVKFDLLDGKGPDLLLDFLRTDYLTLVTKPPYPIDDEFYSDIEKSARSGALQSATILDTGEIIWTKR